MVIGIQFVKSKYILRHRFLCFSFFCKQKNAPSDVKNIFIEILSQWNFFTSGKEAPFILDGGWWWSIKPHTQVDQFRRLSQHQFDCYLWQYYIICYINRALLEEFYVTKKPFIFMIRRWNWSDQHRKFVNVGSRAKLYYSQLIS